MQNIFQKKVRAQILLGGYKMSLRELIALKKENHFDRIQTRRTYFKKDRNSIA